ncbi:MAG: rhodanese-like domain-containing protein [Defluviitaleaceae bacterium]|nr:rhodanese-like domain-containing protein [Defluviitaleaceae bacterium]
MTNILCTLTLGLLFLLTACSNDIGTTYDIGGTPPGIQTITATEAHRIMYNTYDFILLDVRTIPEFEERRIEGAILIPYNELAARADIELSDKNTTILIYCQSGRRSAIALSILAELGYTSLYDFGGIINWPFETISN